MSDAVKGLLAQISALTDEDRQQLLDTLLAEGDGEEGYWDPEYQADLDQRIEDMRSGRDPGMPFDEFMDQMREKYG